MTYVIGIKVQPIFSDISDPITLFVETIHDNLEVSFGTDPTAAMTFNSYEQALTLSNLLDHANPSLPEFLPMELTELPDADQDQS